LTQPFSSRSEAMSLRLCIGLWSIRNECVLAMWLRPMSRFCKRLLIRTHLANRPAGAAFLTSVSRLMIWVVAVSARLSYIASVERDEICEPVVTCRGSRSEGNETALQSSPSISCSRADRA